jgi:hypothetical protein
VPRAADTELDEDDAVRTAEKRNGEPFRRPLPWFRVLVLSGLMVAGLVQLAQRAFREGSDRPGPTAAAAPVAPEPIWTPVIRATAIYGIDRSPLPVAAEARRHRGGLQEDILTIGVFGQAGYGRISFGLGSSDRPAGSLFVETVRRAADAGLSVLRHAPSHTLATKFGPAETASVTLAADGEQSCQAFRFRDPDADFGFHGWLCGSAGQPPEDGPIACLMDRIVLAGGDDLRLKAIFAEAEGQRLGACPAVSRTAAILLNSPGRP